MECRTCPMCNKKIKYDSPICTHCNKGVFVVDFGDSAERLIADNFFDKPNVYEICGFHSKTVIKGVTPEKPPNEWRCERYKPVLFHEINK